MAHWKDMVLIMAIPNWAQQMGHDVALRCGHCRRDTTLRQCAYTAPTWEADGTTTTGGLACPHCGRATSQAAVRAYTRIENARRREAEAADVLNL